MEENMERLELKKLLKELGVKEELTEMPAVVEPLYKEVINKTVEEVKSSGKIIVVEEGMCVIDNYYLKEYYKTIGRKISFDKENGGATIQYADQIITVNKYGIEVGYEDGDWVGVFSNVIRKDGFVENIYRK